MGQRNLLEQSLSLALSFFQQNIDDWRDFFRLRAEPKSPSPPYKRGLEQIIFSQELSIVQSSFFLKMLQNELYEHLCHCCSEERERERERMKK